MIFIDGISKIKLIIVRISVMVHAHDFPCNNPHAITNEITPIPTTTLLIVPITAASPFPIMFIPIEPAMVPNKTPNAMAITPEIISSIARIVTPVGLTLVDTNSQKTTRI